LRSTEHRETKKAVRVFNEKLDRGEISLAPVDPKIFLLCRCRSFQYPHELDKHHELRNDFDWRLPADRHDFSLRHQVT